MPETPRTDLCKIKIKPYKELHESIVWYQNYGFPLTDLSDEPIEPHEIVDELEKRLEKLNLSEAVSLLARIRLNLDPKPIPRARGELRESIQKAMAQHLEMPLPSAYSDFDQRAAQNKAYDKRMADAKQDFEQLADLVFEKMLTSFCECTKK